MDRDRACTPHLEPWQRYARFRRRRRVVRKLIAAAKPSAALTGEVVMGRKITPLAALGRGVLAGAAGTVAMDTLMYRWT